jgi:hypothetical protein
LSARVATFGVAYAGRYAQREGTCVGATREEHGVRATPSSFSMENATRINAPRVPVAAICELSASVSAFASVQSIGELY